LKIGVAGSGATPNITPAAILDFESLKVLPPQALHLSLTLSSDKERALDPDPDSINNSPTR
jgi:hypothetical protein